MNKEKFLVLIKNQDRTEDLLCFNSCRNYIELIYKNSQIKYKCSRSDFKLLKNPEWINVEENLFFIDNGILNNIKKVMKFDEYYKIFFLNEKSMVVKWNLLRIIDKSKFEKQSLSISKLEYFKEISEIVSLKTDDNRLLLTCEFEKINYVQKDTALYNYLKTSNEIHCDYNDLNQLIFPFGANKSQIKAVKNAIENKISIIEGPPGTGKTQTILNIIANIVKNGKNVAVVSNNNAATDNIYEKLKKYKFDYLCAVLGKKENKLEFINNQIGEYPIFEQSTKNIAQLEYEIKNLNQDVDTIFSLENENAKLKELLNELKVEHHYFEVQNSTENVKEPKIKNIKRINSNQLMKLIVELENFNKKDKINWMFFKLKSRFWYAIGEKSFYNNDIEDIINGYYKIYYLIYEYEIKNKILENNRKIKIIGKGKLDKLINNSVNLLNEYLNNRYNGRTKRNIFSIEDLYKRPKEFNEEYPIILSTTYSIKNCLNNSYMFDYIIMDEASQIDLITGILALSSAKNAVIVGDLKQLPNVISTKDRLLIKQLTQKYEIEEKYNYLNHSFLSSASAAISEVPKVLLKEHYRCHPKIINFCNKKFYNNELIIMTEDKGEKDVIKVYVTSEGNHARGKINQRQIDVIENEVIKELENKVNKEEIGIISPYRAQKSKMEKIFESNMQIDTVHKFQGREKDAIIITTVDNEIGDFVDDPKMLNVAVTRAKKYLRIVVSNSEKNEGTNISDLIKYIEYNNYEIVESKVKSIYDLLYKNNRKKRLEYLKNKKMISEFDSENITYNFIKEILDENNYDNLDIAVHVPLINLLTNIDELNEKEIKFATNTWTHVDFVLFNKMNKKVFLVIEVDGYYYHKEGTAQNIRDGLKNSILEKYAIPLLRLSTVGSGEKEKIEREIEKNI